MVKITGFVRQKEELKDYCAFGIVEGMEYGIPLIQEEGFQDGKWKLLGGKSEEVDKENGILRPENSVMREIVEKGGIHICQIVEKPFLVKPKVNKYNAKYDFIVFITKYSHGALRPGKGIKKTWEFSIKETEEMINLGKIVDDHAEALSEYINRKKALDLDSIPNMF